MLAYEHPPRTFWSRFYYVYAVDYDRGGVWGGKAVMCTRDKMFTIRGIEDCVARLRIVLRPR